MVQFVPVRIEFDRGPVCNDGARDGTVDSATHDLYVYDGRVDELDVYAPHPAALGRNYSARHR